MTHSRVAVVTGGSGGIGLELARLCVRDKYHVVLVARDSPRLERARQDLIKNHGADVTLVPADLADPESPGRIAGELGRRGLECDILINNAGFGASGFFASTDIATEVEMLQVNITALTQLTNLFLRPMLRRRRGHILNVASTAAFLPGPLMAVYYATKAYVLSFSQALHNETQGTGVTVTALCPGATRTGFQARAGLQTARLLDAIVADAASVARAGYEGMFRGEDVVVPGISNKAVALGTKLLPRGFTASLARWAQENRGRRVKSSVSVQ